MADSPLARRREAGAILRGYRGRLGLTAGEVAAELGMSPAKMSRLERGERGLRVEDVRAICQRYGLSESETNRVLALVRESQGRGSWGSADLPDTMRVFFGLEEGASTVQGFQQEYVPGVLQTERYARVITAGSRPEGMLSEEVQASRVQIRMRRRELLAPVLGKSFHFVIDEAVLVRRVLPPAGMAEQIAAVIDVSAQDNVKVQVVPFSAGAYPGMSGSFTILRFAEELLEDSVFIEDLSGYSFYETEHQLARFRRIFDDIASVALNDQDSRALLADSLSRWRTGE